MSYEALIYLKDAGIAIVTLNRPERRNALNTVLVGELNRLFDEMTDDPEVKVVILTGGRQILLRRIRPEGTISHPAV